MKGIEIAKKLNISTSALRHYESWSPVLLFLTQFPKDFAKKDTPNLLNKCIINVLKRLKSHH
ncbi:hypothetical protein BTR23_14010 [Alkalihalophilus pseudofirmus]|nr:hypothetical protein BTR23_14010 [Alkalihalophilus pseudofirmus]